MKSLTNYDKYVLSRKKSDVASEKNTFIGSGSNDYESYLINELRRTTPSANKVLREDEFYNARRNCNNVAVVETKEQEKNNTRFKIRKGGKIFLIIYVILMLALASILIVSNTTSNSAMLDGISFNQSAGAASSDESDSAASVRPMTVEDDTTEETNWFDKLCDSLNK